MKILSIDGGGVFGIAPATVIEMAGTQGVMDKFDVFTGTSIGAVIALALANELPVAVSADYFHNWMPKIFKSGVIRKRFSLFYPRYNDAGLNAALQHIFDGIPLMAAKKPVFAVAVNVGSRSLKVFKSTEFSDGAWPCWEVARASAAAPTYFRPWKGLADGGVFANNPSMVGVAGIARSMGKSLSEVELFSMGTGDAGGFSSKTPRGRLGWGAWLIQAMLDGSSSGMHEYFTRSMPLKSYQRWQFVRNPKWDMDSVRNMKNAELAWAADLHRAAEALKEF